MFNLEGNKFKKNKCKRKFRKKKSNKKRPKEVDINVSSPQAESDQLENPRRKELDPQKQTLRKLKERNIRMIRRRTSKKLGGLFQFKKWSSNKICPIHNDILKEIEFNHLNTGNWRESFMILREEY
jgi:hypothetical protein